MYLQIKRHKEYISELILHADAQAVKYQHKVRTKRNLIQVCVINNLYKKEKLKLAIVDCGFAPGYVRRSALNLLIQKNMRLQNKIKKIIQCCDH